MSLKRTNLFFASHSSGKGEEEVVALLDTPTFRLEQIVSHGQVSPPGFWYDQPRPEWILLMRGNSTLDFGEEGKVELKAGDCLLIPAHSKHRVETVSEDAVWLALHFFEGGPLPVTNPQHL